MQLQKGTDMIEVKPNSRAAYQLFHDGTLALNKVERNGMRVDVDYCKKQRHRLGRKISFLKSKIEKSPEIKRWKRAKPDTVFNIDSGPQLGDALFKYSNHTSFKETPTGKPSTDEESLKSLNLLLVNDILEVRKLSKAKNTYLGGFIREQVDTWLHPFFGLNLVVSFRGQSNNINFQNVPTRLPDIKKLCRQAIIPRTNGMLVEIDYQGAEVKSTTCYHHDPAMLDEINNPKRDMHRDMAMECYLLGLDEWTKTTRYCSKNMFIFPQFYGDWWKQCANNLWKAIVNMDLKTAQGVPLRKHLRSKGIKTLAQFEKHIKKVEDDFWNRRFKVYNQWKKDHIELYHKTGVIHLLTGFTCQGLMDNKQVVNYPPQGTAFHWLLWSLAKLQKWLEAHNLNTKIIGQIHDSIVLDADPSELGMVLAKAEQIMTLDIKRHWPWIITPLGIEVEASPVNGSWYLKDEIKKGTPCGSCQNTWWYQKKIEGSSMIRYICPMCGEKWDALPF